jgi:uncharacterized membrane protein YedE/YeeE
MSEFTKVIKNGYSKIFYENWPLWVGGILIGILSILTFMWSRPWGVAGGVRNWGDNLFYLIGLYSKKPMNPLLSSSSLLTLGLLIGAFLSALLSKQFAFQRAPLLEIIKGMVGGILMGIGASMAGGCNVGGFFSATSALSLSGLLMMFGLMVGANLGLRYLYWELEHLPSAGGGGTSSSSKESKGLKSIEPYLGVIGILAILLWVWYYSQQGLTRLGGLLLFGVCFGIVIQRTRFCFVRCFREPFMTGEADAPIAMAVAVIISVLGFAILKYTGLRPEHIYVVDAVWFGALIGGLIFGFGMVIAGGCGSGSVWRCGEGQSKLMVVVFFFALSMSLFEKFTDTHPAFKKFLGTKIYLPEYIGYVPSVILVILIMVFYMIWAKWNEETEKFVVEL